MGLRRKDKRKTCAKCCEPLYAVCAVLLPCMMFGFNCVYCSVAMTFLINFVYCPGTMFFDCFLFLFFLQYNALHMLSSLHNILRIFMLI